jgi:sigma-B regulation protein RsbU (phosphoserine phosphatase)
VCRPAGDIGGELCDVVEIGAGGSAFLLGDVSGKGTGAALLTANLQATIRGSLEFAGEPAKLIARANRLFCQSTAPEH